MVRLIYLLLIQAIFVFTSIASACGSAPEHMYLSHDEAIDDAEWIALAKGINRADGGIKMSAVEYLKGEGPATFILPRATTDGAQDDELAPSDSNYYGHTVSTFWTHGGRSFNKPDCEIHPSILFGERQYLIFGPLDYNVGFENIAGADDVWLQYVRNHVSGQNTERPFPAKLTNYLENAWAIVRYRAIWEDGAATWTEEVLKGTEKSYAHMLFLSPPAFFDTAVNPGCTRYGKPRSLGTFDRIYVIETRPQSEVLSFQHVECVGADKGSVGTIRGRGIFSINGSTEIRVITSADTEVLSPYFGKHSPLWIDQSVTLEHLLAVVKSLQ